MTNFLKKNKFLNNKFFDTDLLNAIDARMCNLDNYINSKELNELQWLKSNIETGIYAMNRASWFLSKVPEGEYDNTRRKYQFYDLDNFLHDQCN
jgi:hypothetical protein